MMKMIIQCIIHDKDNADWRNRKQSKEDEMKIVEDFKSRKNMIQTVNCSYEQLPIYSNGILIMVIFYLSNCLRCRNPNRKWCILDEQTSHEKQNRAMDWACEKGGTKNGVRKNTMFFTSGLEVLDLSSSKLHFLFGFLILFLIIIP